MEKQKWENCFGPAPAAFERSVLQALQQKSKKKRKSRLPLWGAVAGIAALTACAVLIAGGALRRPDAMARPEMTATGRVPPALSVSPKGGFFVGAEHRSTVGFPRAFTGRVRSDDRLTLFLEEDLYQEELAEILWETARSDLERLAAFLQVECAPCRIYVVRELVGGEMQGRQGSLYCTAEQLTGGEYQELLPRALTGCAPWQSLGLCVAYRQQAPVNKPLTSYYRTADSLDMLSLSPFWFNRKYANVKEICLARNTAIAFTAWLLEQEDVTAFLDKTPGDAERTAWLASIGVDRVYRDAWPGAEEPFDISDGGAYGAVAEDRVFNMIFYLGSGSTEDTPTAMRKALYRAHRGTEAILRTAAELAPDYAPRMEAALQEGQPLRVYTGCTGKLGVNGRQMNVAYANSFLSALISEVLLPGTEDYRTRWALEGLCGNWGTLFYPDETVLQDFRAALAEVLPYADDAAVRLSLDYALQLQAALWLEDHGGLFSASIGTIVDAAAWFEGQAEEKYTVTQHAREYFRTALPAEPPENGLGYCYESTGFVRYLADRLGLNAVLRYCFDQPMDFETAFGLTYAEAYADWRGTLEQIYGGN